MQLYKSVYFADFPADDARRRNLTIAFGPDDGDVHETISQLTSVEIRNLLGHSEFMGLKAEAESRNVTVNALCVDRLRRVTTNGSDGGQLRIPLDANVEVPDRLVDPIHATYRGGSAEPLHGWYPYLEGYSPDFVTTLLRELAPKSRRILDPFAGTGTTPLTAVRDDRAAYYCELNPVLQHLIQAKSLVLSMASKDRLQLAEKLLALANDLTAGSAAHFEPDRGLERAYVASFGNSQFFPPDTFNDCLQLRSWLDSVSCSSPAAASIATVAVIASLIPSSNLVRRGDVRFRKDAERDARVDDVVGAVAARLEAMSEELLALGNSTKQPLLVAGDAKRLQRIRPLRVDAILTSPPYLNGTNYYRNTKLELWFQRAVRSSDDLATFRLHTVTAGINDVTTRKDFEPASASIASVVDQLETSAYDRRIPQMVASYFTDMRQVLAGLRRHAQPGSPLLMDIGDSAYAGVHVDTPTLLRELLEVDGWECESEVLLRDRLSRGGQRLRQVLLVARAPASKTHTSPRPSRRMDVRAWAAFKRELPHQEGPFAKRNWGSRLHSLCSYQGKMKPALAHHLVKAFCREGDQLLDPFGGVGTIAFEAASLGIKTWSYDISPAAVPIAAAKLQPTSASEVESVLVSLGEFIGHERVTPNERRIADEVRFNGAIADYFHEQTFEEILLARRFFKKIPPHDPATAMIFACLLHILHGNRPYALSRRSHPITPFAPTGPFEYKSLVAKLNEKVARALAVDRPARFVPGSSLYQDATALWPTEVDDLDAIITSPPFFDSTRFYLANWMRLWFAGWTASDFKIRPRSFVDERQKVSFEVYEPVIRQARERLRPGGLCVFHLGKSRKCDMAEKVSRIAKPWFDKSEVFVENVEHCESHGIRDKGTVVAHTYLVLR